MTIRIVYLLLILGTVYSKGHAQDSVRRSDGFRFVDGAFYNLSAPFRWDKKDWMKCGLVVSGTAALTLLDEPVRNAWKPVDNQFLDRVNGIGDEYGRTTSALFFSGGFYVTGLVVKNEWARETGIMLGSALATTATIQTVLKPLVGRARPYTEDGPHSFRPFYPGHEYHSFPSGHTCIALTITFVMARRVDSVPLKMLFYSLAASTVVCRMYSDAHWLSDIGFATAAAWFSAESSVRRVTSMRYRRTSSPVVNIFPYPGGLTLRMRF